MVVHRLSSVVLHCWIFSEIILFLLAFCITSNATIGDAATESLCMKQQQCADVK